VADDHNGSVQAAGQGQDQTRSWWSAARIRFGCWPWPMGWSPFSSPCWCWRSGSRAAPGPVPGPGPGRAAAVADRLVISFVVAAMSWVGHRDLFALIRRTDRGLVWLNLLYLLPLCLLPFGPGCLVVMSRSRWRCGSMGCCWSWWRAWGWASGAMPPVAPAAVAAAGGSSAPGRAGLSGRGSGRRGRPGPEPWRSMLVCRCCIFSASPFCGVAGGGTRSTPTSPDRPPPGAALIP
jgi:Endosomal/lysosomal potassium channel TMEM175